MYKFKCLKPVCAVSAAVLLLCSCATEKSSAEFYAFDTYCGITLYGGENELSSMKELMEDMSSEFQNAYGTDANTLTGEYISDCAERSLLLSKEIGGGLNVTCGALTELWGISTDTPSVPSQEDIDKALGTLRGGFDSLSELPDGTRLDLGASAKGYACDKAAELLSVSDTSCAVVSLGSSTLLYGEKPDGSSFKAAVKNPDKPSEYLGIINTSAAFISTSGGYERYFEQDGVKYGHILSAETGYPVETDLTSVTVIVPYGTENGGILSDMLATAVYSGGTAELERYMDREDCFIIAADENRKVYVSRGVDFTLYENTGFSFSE